MLVIENEKVRAQILEAEPYCESYTSSIGSGESLLAITAVLADGSRKELLQGIVARYASNHTPNRETIAPLVREQIASWSVNGLICVMSEDYDYRDSYDHEYTVEDFRDGLPTLGNGEEVEFYVPLQPMDWKAVRRRVEDRLRKDESAMRQCAALLDVKIW